MVARMLTAALTVGALLESCHTKAAETIWQCTSVLRGNIQVFDKPCQKFSLGNGFTVARGTVLFTPALFGGAV